MRGKRTPAAGVMDRSKDQGRHGKCSNGGSHSQLPVGSGDAYVVFSQPSCRVHHTWLVCVSVCVLACGVRAICCTHCGLFFFLLFPNRWQM